MTFEEGINKLTYAFLEILSLAENYFGNRDKNAGFVREVYWSSTC
jgi:hypothetical protein